MEIEEALRIVEGAGLTVADDRQTRSYYQQHEPRFKALLDRAKSGDWIAAEDLLNHIRARPRQITYSSSLVEFMAFIMSELLSRRSITSATKSSTRMKNPLLAAVLKTDGRKDYQRNVKSRKVKNLLDAAAENGVKEHFIARLENEGIPVDTQNKLLANAKKIG